MPTAHVARDIVYRSLGGSEATLRGFAKLRYASQPSTLPYPEQGQLRGHTCGDFGSPPGQFAACTTLIGALIASTIMRLVRSGRLPDRVGRSQTSQDAPDTALM